jgi:hypothetical protein
MRLLISVEVKDEQLALFAKQAGVIPESLEPETMSFYWGFRDGHGMIRPMNYITTHRSPEFRIVPGNIAEDIAKRVVEGLGLVRVVVETRGGIGQ